MDVCDENDPDLSANCVASHHGIMPELVNNAVITKALLKTLHTFRERDWPQAAKVIPVSSTFGLVGWPWQWSDHAAKFADVGMSGLPIKKSFIPYEDASPSCSREVYQCEALEMVELQLVSALQGPRNAPSDYFPDGIARLRAWSKRR